MQHYDICFSVLKIYAKLNTLSGLIIEHPIEYLL